MATTVQPSAWTRLHKRGPRWEEMKTCGESKTLCHLEWRSSRTAGCSYNFFLFGFCWVVLSWCWLGPCPFFLRECHHDVCFDLCLWKSLSRWPCFFFDGLCGVPTVLFEDIRWHTGGSRALQVQPKCQHSLSQVLPWLVPSFFHLPFSLLWSIFSELLCQR